MEENLHMKWWVEDVPCLKHGNVYCLEPFNVAYTIIKANRDRFVDEHTAKHVINVLILSPVQCNRNRSTQALA